MVAAIIGLALGGARLLGTGGRLSASADSAAHPEHSPTIQPAGFAPRIGQITIGAFAPETAPLSGLDNLSLLSLDNDSNYTAYRNAVRQVYGADLADMNYLGVGSPDWPIRYQTFAHWLARAGRYGDPTIAIEPNDSPNYAIFSDNPEMRALRDVFRTAGQSGITVWIRFASESNLKFSGYTVYNDDAKIAAYRHSVRWFRRYMPSNVRLVFSPLINTIYLKDPRQIRTIVAMYEPGVYDRIGGTIYATSWLRPRDAFDWYYHFMRARDPHTPFQICELGGTYPRSDEVKAFLVRVARGDWPGVQRVNLFAGDLNPTATSEHGHFGFILPGASTSYLSDLFPDATGHSNYAELAGSDKELTHLEALSAGWRSPEMTIGGKVTRIARGWARLSVSVEYVTDELGEQTPLVPSRGKEVIIAPECVGADALTGAGPGTSIQATGWDSGTGTPLRATKITVGSAAQSYLGSFLATPETGRG